MKRATLITAALVLLCQAFTVQADDAPKKQKQGAAPATPRRARPAR